MTGIPPDFGGVLGCWIDGYAMLGHYGHGTLVSGIVLTPINLLQARKTLDVLIEQGRSEGRITDEHVRLADHYHPVDPKDLPPRGTVDEILGFE